MDIAKLTISKAVEGLDAKAFSAVELTQSVLDAIAAKDGAIHAYLSIDGETALQQAKAADAARAAGQRGALLGVPVAVKDIINVDGQPCTCASKMLQGGLAIDREVGVNRAIFRRNGIQHALRQFNSGKRFRIQSFNSFADRQFRDVHNLRLFHNLRQFHFVSVPLRRIGDRTFAVKRGHHHILAQHIDQRLTMQRRFNPGNVQLRDLLHVADDPLQLLLERCALLRRQRQPRQLRHIGHINCLTHAQSSADYS
jgi:hypothetical protein